MCEGSLKQNIDVKHHLKLAVVILPGHKYLSKSMSTTCLYEWNNSFKTES